MIIDGKKIADEIQNEIRGMIGQISGRKPCLAVLLVGEHPASKIYIGRKTQACESVGILSIERQLPSNITQQELYEEISALNRDPNVDGILVQLPLPEQINSYKVTQWIDPAKDVDGFHPLNVGKMLIGETDGFFPCTPLGIKVLLERTGIDLSGKHVVILGRSNIVGKPMAALIMQNSKGANATVTVANSKTQNLKELCFSADVIISAMGNPRFVTMDMVKDGAIVVDVGINRIKDSTKKSGFLIVGDVDFVNVEKKCLYITPVPGGVGPMTIAMLLSNTLKSFFARSLV